MKTTRIDAYMCICEHCGDHATGYNDFSVFMDRSDAQEAAMESDWNELDGKLYCNQCSKLDPDIDDKVILTIEGRKKIS